MATFAPDVSNLKIITILTAGSLMHDVLYSAYTNGIPNFGILTDENRNIYDIA